MICDVHSYVKTTQGIRHKPSHCHFGNEGQISHKVGLKTSDPPIFRFPRSPPLSPNINKIPSPAMSTYNTTKTIAGLRLLCREASLPCSPTLFRYTAAVDENQCIFPKRFSISRDVYFTTNSRGEVLKVANPSKQFKSRLAKSLDSDPAKKVVELGYTTQHSTKSYRSLSDTDSVLTKAVKGMVHSPSNKALDKTGASIFLNRYIKHAKNPEKLSPFSSPLNYPQGVQKALRLTMHLLKIGYVSAFGDSIPSAKADFERYDFMLSYLVLSLIHVPLFGTRFEEMQFYQSLETNTSITRTILKSVSYSYKEFLEDLTPVYTIDDAVEKVTISAIPYELQLKRTFFHKNPQHIQNYMQGISPSDNTWEGVDGLPWFSVAYQRTVRQHRIFIEKVFHLELRISLLENNSADECGDLQLIHARKEFSKMKEVCLYKSDTDFIHKSSLSFLLGGLGLFMI